VGPPTTELPLERGGGVGFGSSQREVLWFGETEDRDGGKAGLDERTQKKGKGGKKTIEYTPTYETIQNEERNRRKNRASFTPNKKLEK